MNKRDFKTQSIGQGKVIHLYVGLWTGKKILHRLMV